MMTTPAEFYLLRPDELPRQRAVLHADRATCAVLAPVAAALAAWQPDDDVLKATRAALAALALTEADLVRIADDPDESFESRANDQSFRIVRVRGHATRVLANSTLLAFALLWEDARDGGCELDAGAWARLRHALATIVARLANAPVQAPRDALAPPRSHPARPRDALRRWQHGHYAFMAIVQGLILTLHELGEAFARDDEDAMVAALIDATAIMAGTQAALRFAGDFAFADYNAAVRPTLMPPIAPPGMTGLHWRDHRFMISLLVRLRPSFAAMPARARVALEALYAATADAYESHKYVCASFVGTERPSLLMASRSEKTAVETLDHFKHIRLGLLDAHRAAPVRSERARTPHGVPTDNDNS